MKKSRDLALSGLIFGLILGAPLEKKQPWQKPCAGSHPAGVHFVTPTDINADEVIQRLAQKIQMLMQNIDETFLYLNDGLINDADLISALDARSRLNGYPSDCVPPQKKDSGVLKENYLKMSQVFIFLGHFKHFEIDKTLNERSSRIVTSMNDILCEYSSLVDISDYPAIISLSRNIISQEYNALTATRFYGWDFVLLRDTKTFAKSMLNMVKYIQLGK